MAKNLKHAVEAIERRGCLLVFPVNNRKEPPSLWREFYPRSEMRWEWDDDGDNRVAGLWHLRTELSESGKVVYTKWWRGRATFFSRGLFTAMLRSLASPTGLSTTARSLLRALELESPLSTKELKRAADLRGRGNEAAYARALKELWERLLIVGYGEVDDGAFPSLALGATRVVFEDLWLASRELGREEAERAVEAALGKGTPLMKFYRGLERSAGTAPSVVDGASLRGTASHY